ncbi:hypothetical protein VTK26DRAFT_9003 [Humicola hyalothermophila]
MGSTQSRNSNGARLERYLCRKLMFCTKYIPLLHLKKISGGCGLGDRRRLQCYVVAILLSHEQPPVKGTHLLRSSKSDN